MLMTIPLIVDDVKNTGSFPATRLIYFSIEQEKPAAGWSLGLPNLTIPLYSLNLSGILYQPPHPDEWFDTPDKIERSFLMIESTDAFFVDTNDIWLPNVLFEKTAAPTRGNVYRVPDRLFDIAYAFRLGTISFDELAEQAVEYGHQVQFSQNETKAFNLWGKDQIGQAIEMFPKNSELVLKYEE